MLGRQVERLREPQPRPAICVRRQREQGQLRAPHVLLAGLVLQAPEGLPQLHEGHNYVVVGARRIRWYLFSVCFESCGGAAALDSDKRNACCYQVHWEGEEDTGITRWQIAQDHGCLLVTSLQLAQTWVGSSQSLQFEMTQQHPPSTQHPGPGHAIGGECMGSVSTLKVAAEGARRREGLTIATLGRPTPARPAVS